MPGGQTSPFIIPDRLHLLHIAHANQLYGPDDNFGLDSGHVLPALLRKADDAKRAAASAMTVWGTGTPRREFLHVDDLADAVVFLTENYSQEEHINIGTGEDTQSKIFALLVCDVVGFQGEIEFDASKPDGTSLKCFDISRLRGLGWSPTIDLRTGLERTYSPFLENAGNS